MFLTKQLSVHHSARLKITSRSLSILQVASGFMAPAPIALRTNAARYVQLRRPATGVTALTAKTVGDTVMRECLL